MTDAFARANRHWFDGRIAAALREYEVAHEAAPDDPVVVYQWSVALWAVDRFKEARHAAAVAARHAARLSDIGRIALRQWQQVVERLPERHAPEIPVELLDRDALEERRVDDWRRVAEAAHERGMSGLARYAIDQWDGTPLDAEDARDIGRLTGDAHGDRSLLEQMAGPAPRGSS